MHRLVAVLVLLWVPTLVLAGNRFHERNHTGLLVLYGFDDGQRSSNLHPTSARDFTGRDILGNLTMSTSAVAWSSERAGFSIPQPGGGERAVSQKSTSDLLARLSTEFSMEIFLMSPRNLGTGNLLIAGFGDWPANSPFPPCESGPSSSEGGLRTYSSPGNGIHTQIVMLDGESPACFELSFTNTPNALRHMVIRAREGETSVATHGGVSQVVDGQIAFLPSLWARHVAPLTIAVPPPSSGWQGSVYLIAIFDRYLTNDNVATNQALGPPNSLPVTLTPSIPLTEDLAASLYP